MGSSLQTPREIMSQDEQETVQWVLDFLVGDHFITPTTILSI